MTVQNYKGRYADFKIAPVTDEDVQAVYKNELEQNPDLAPVDRPAQLGDTLVFDFAGFCDGEQFQGGTAENYELVLGSHQFIPGFEEQLVGMSAGETKDVNVTFPQQYTPELAGKDAVFKCTAHTVMEQTESTLNDEFVKKVFGRETVEDCNDYIKRGLESNARTEALEQFLEILAAENNISAAKEEVDKELDSMISGLIMQMTGQPMTKEQFCQASGMPLEDLDAGLRPTAEGNLRKRAVLFAIAEAEGIKATEEERMVQLAAIAGRFGMTAEQFKGMIEDDEIDFDIVLRKTMDFVIEANTAK